ncbi:MAG: ribosome biogenesis GTPase Der [Acidobacteriota bacterium]
MLYFDVMSRNDLQAKRRGVLIVGAPNVGKSTLFNRLIGKRKSIVYSEPGVTRDMVTGEFIDGNVRFTVTDTGGLIPSSSEKISKAVQRQVARAVQDFVLTLLVVDAQRGVTPLDENIALFLIKSGTRIILCVNKMDAPGREEILFPFYALGVGDPIPISAEHSLGLDLLIERIERGLEDSAPLIEKAVRSETDGMRVVISGRQNVGKSSLLNALLNDNRMIVSEAPGTTVDSVDSLLELKGKRYIIVDTAGIRKKKRVRGPVEKIAVIKARQNIKMGDVVILVLDSMEGMTAQDVSIAGYAIDSLKPLLILFNKWDLMENREEAARRLKDQVDRKLRFMKGIPVLFVSALSGAGIRKILPAVDLLYCKYTMRIRTSELNKLVLKTARAHALFSSSSFATKIFYMVQAGVGPQRFIVFANNAKNISASQRRFLENLIRDKFDLSPVPVRMEFREGKKVKLETQK